LLQLAVDRDLLLQTIDHRLLLQGTDWTRIVNSLCNYLLEYVDQAKLSSIIFFTKFAGFYE
jgi:hypothetical protein